MKLMLLAALAVATPVMAQDVSAPAPQTTPAPAADPAAPDPVGGYQPSQPPISGPVAPGVTPQFVQAPPPDQAYPAPAPLAHYPVCKRGQFDNCLERHSRK